MNKLRLEKLKVKIECVNSVFEEAKQQLISRIKNKAEDYRNVLRNLLVQGFIKLLEENVNIICKKEDYDVITGVVAEAQDKFLELLNKESKKFKNFKMVVSVDTKYYLPDYM
jgi:V-type H+-transporting ATPase subunit E